MNLTVEVILERAFTVAVVGAGYWGEKLIRVFRATDGLRVLGVCDHHEERLANVGGGIATTRAIEELLQRADLDAVAIATPPSTHYVLARQALAAGKHCWVEKPLALCAEEARELVQLARARQRMLFVDETFLYDPLVQRAKQWIDSGRLGRLFHMSFERLGMGRIRRDSDVWWNSAPHDLSILCYLVPAAVESMRVDQLSYLQEGIADMAIATVRLSGGVSAHIYLSWLSPLKVASIVAVGSQGMLHFEGRFEHRALRFFDYAVADPATATDNVLSIERFTAAEVVTAGSEEPLALAAQAFVRSLRTGTAAVSAGEYSQRVVELLELAQDGGHPSC